MVDAPRRSSRRPLFCCVDGEYRDGGATYETSIRCAFWATDRAGGWGSPVRRRTPQGRARPLVAGPRVSCSVCRHSDSRAECRRHARRGDERRADSDVIIMAAAVDYAPAHPVAEKIAKSDAPMTLPSTARRTSWPPRLDAMFGSRVGTAVPSALPRRRAT